MDEIDAIVRGLTPQMRHALTWPKEPMLVPNTLYAATINGLERRGLSDRYYALTPLGLAVRARLTTPTEAPNGD